MKGWGRFSRLLIMGTVIACLMTACRHSDDLPGNEMEGFRLAIRVSAPNSTLTQSVDEKIKSLRLIMLDGEKVELNTHITFPDNLAKDFVYNLILYTNEGSKSFYIFANEESVRELSFTASSTDTPPTTDDTDTSTNLTEILDGFTKGNPATGLQDILYSAYFTPSYTVENGSIYLPYASYYGGDFELTVGKGHLEVADLFLVPVATKFIFKFTNYRDNPIGVNNITLSFANQQNYLLAHVGESNMTMTLPGESEGRYWVDWLAEVSKLSKDNRNASQNLNFNDRYGWILDYTVPEGYAAITNVFVAEDNKFVISGKPTTPNGVEGSDDTPGTFTAGPFYVPESVNEAPESAANKLPPQEYYISMDFEDLGSNNETPPFEMVALPNLKALFRNTYVIINIIMKQGDIELYAKTMDWQTNEAYGHVREDTERPDVD